MALLADLRTAQRELERLMSGVRRLLDSTGRKRLVAPRPG
jgi:hypothetical protein